MKMNFRLIEWDGNRQVCVAKTSNLAIYKITTLLEVFYDVYSGKSVPKGAIAIEDSNWPREYWARFDNLETAYQFATKENHEIL